MHFVKQIVIVLSDGLKTETLSYLFITFSKGNCNYQPTSAKGPSLMWKKRFSRAQCRNVVLRLLPADCGCSALESGVPISNPAVGSYGGGGRPLFSIFGIDLIPRIFDSIS